jgi:hypothetical protein
MEFAPSGRAAHRRAGVHPFVRRGLRRSVRGRERIQVKSAAPETRRCPSSSRAMASRRTRLRRHSELRRCRSSALAGPLARSDHRISRTWLQPRSALDLARSDLALDLHPPKWHRNEPGESEKHGERAERPKFAASPEASRDSQTRNPCAPGSTARRNQARVVGSQTPHRYEPRSSDP